MVYGCTWKILDVQGLASDFFSDLALTDQRRKYWLVSFTATKHKVMFCPQRADREFSSIVMHACCLGEASYCERLLGLNPDRKWNTYDTSLKMLRKVPDSCYPLSDQAENGLLLPYIRKSCPAQNFPISTESQSFLSGFVVCHNNSLFERTKYCRPLATLSLFPWKIFRRTTSLVLPVLRSKFETRRATPIVANRLHSFRIRWMRRKFNSGSFFSGTPASWNRLPKGYFPDRYNLNFFMSWVKLYFPYSSPSSAPLISCYVKLFQTCIGWTLL